MGYAFRFDAACRLIRVVQEGPADTTDALEAMREVRTHPEFRPHYPILCDFRGGEFRGNSLDPGRIGGVIRAFFPGQRIALVFSEAARENTGKLVGGFASPAADVRVFNALAAAEAWLIEPPR